MVPGPIHGGPGTVRPAGYRMARVDSPLVEAPSGPLDPFFHANRPEDLA